MISGPFLRVGPSEALAGAQGFVASLQAGIMSLPVPDISSGLYDGIGPSSPDGCMAPLGVINAIGGDTADPLMYRDLRQQTGQNGRISDAVAGHLDRANFKGFSVDTYVDLAPLPATAGPMLADLPLAFA